MSPATPDRRFHCTKDHPWNPTLPRPVVHEETHRVGGQREGWPGGDLVTLRCPNCGHTWEQELPQ